MHGLIARYNSKKGYGFIKCLNGGCPKPIPDVFFHHSQLIGVSSLPLGARVKFIIVDGKDGKTQAAQVRPLELSGQELTERPLRRRDENAS